MSAANPPSGQQPPNGGASGPGAQQGSGWVRNLLNDPANAERVFQEMQSERDSLRAKVNQIESSLEHISPYLDRYGGEQTRKFLDEYASFATKDELVQGIYHYMQNGSFPSGQGQGDYEQGSSQGREDGEMVFTPEEEAINGRLAKLEKLLEGLAGRMDSTTAALGGTSVETHMDSVAARLGLPPEIADRVKGSIRQEVEAMKRRGDSSLGNFLGPQAEKIIQQSMQSYLGPDDWSKISEHQALRRQSELGAFETDGPSPVPTNGSETVPANLQWDDPADLVNYAEANLDKIQNL